MKRFVTIFVVSAALWVSACSDGKVIKDEQKAASLYVDLLVAMEQNRGTDTLKLKQARKKVYSKYDVTEDEFKATLEYYNGNKERWDSFFENVNKVLIAKRKESEGGAF